ncbi:TIR domain-containing protein [Vagococcus xieshaowenii]|nr:nucleotide-binding protein [Vagococcus xieshaowenii]
MKNEKYHYPYDIVCKEILNGRLKFEEQPNVSPLKALNDLKKKVALLKTIVSRNDFPTQTENFLEILSNINLSGRDLSTTRLHTVMDIQVKEELALKYDELEFIGKSLANDYYQLCFRSEEEEPVKKTEENPVNKNEIKNIFIVHGHDGEMKHDVARTIKNLNINPIILSEQPNGGKTIIEKFESSSEHIDFAIVLVSGDDIQKDGKIRARQNVMYELGYFCGKLGRNRVLILNNKKNGDIEIPSDLYGVLYIEYLPENDSWKLQLVRELKDIDGNINVNLLV